VGEKDATDLAGEYLREVLERSDTPEELLLGLRRIAEAQGMSRVAEAAGLSRESLYRSLSAAGNPRLSTLVAVLRVAGLKLSVRPAASLARCPTFAARKSSA
jgi:probable addiction module antidote protein